MTPEQALQNLDRAIRSLTMNADSHEAFRRLVAEVAKAMAESKEKTN